MVIRELTTPRGGNVCINFGANANTNLWDGKYRLINDMQLVLDLKNALRDPAKLAEIRERERPFLDQKTSPFTYNKASPLYNGGTPSPVEETPVEEPDDAKPDDSVIRAERTEGVVHFMRFFDEFKFRPAARFINTFASCADATTARSYLVNYMRLVNNADTDGVIEKSKSQEFENITNLLLKHKPEKRINKRLELYFGDAGTGKTTEAVKTYKNAPVVPCNAGMLPDELMRTFDFNDANGNPVFKPSVLRACMENGTPSIFDEINLLSFDCLRLLQTLTDDKQTINYNGETITIKDGFKVIGTMNLVVNDQVYNLPEPLVDRAYSLREFKLTPEDLVGYAF